MVGGGGLVLPFYSNMRHLEKQPFRTNLGDWTIAGSFAGKASSALIYIYKKILLLSMDAFPARISTIPNICGVAMRFQRKNLTLNQRQ